MAYRVENTGSLDYQLAIGVSLPFNADGVFNPTYTSTEQIRANLINFILTNKGERPLNATYGSDIRKYLFSEITDSSYAFGITGYDNTNSNPSTTAISGVQPYTNLGVKDLEAQQVDLTLQLEQIRDILKNSSFNDLLKAKDRLDTLVEEFKLEKQSNKETSNRMFSDLYLLKENMKYIPKDENIY
jgi:hypothetical protein